MRQRRRVVVAGRDVAQLVGHRLGGRRTFGGLLGERAADDAIDRRDRRRSGQGRRLLVDRRVQNRDHGVAGERGPAGEHLEQDRAGGEQIGAAVERLAERLFGRHVARRPHHGAGAREIVGAGDLLVHGRARQAEVEQLHAVRRQEHVRRLEIAMNHAAGVQRRQRVEDAQAGRDRFGDAQWRALEPLGQRRALEQFHGDEQHAVVFADLVDLTDVRMVDRRGRARLAPEALARGLVVRRATTSSSTRPRAGASRRARRRPRPSRPRRACARSGNGRAASARRRAGRRTGGAGTPDGGISPAAYARRRRPAAFRP